MKKSTENLIRKIIKDKFLTDWEFILQVIAPEIEQDELDDAGLKRISEMVGAEIIKRTARLYE